MSALVNAIVMLGMLVVVPTGLRLTGQPELERIRRLWPLFAAPGALALWLPRGTTATALSCVYAVGTVLLALHAPRRTVRGRSPDPVGIARLTALAAPAVAATALVAERSGHELFGFDLGILALTVPHFHFAGFAAALIAGLVCRVSDGPAGRFAARGPADLAPGTRGGTGPDDAAPPVLLLRLPGGDDAARAELGARRGDRAPPPHPDLDGRHPWARQRAGLHALLAAGLAAHPHPRRLPHRCPHPHRRQDRMSTLTYPEVGATRLGPLPRGYHHLHHRSRVGRGAADFAAAGAAITEWRMHHASGARVEASARRAEPGTSVRVSLGLGPLRFTAPCEVIWAAYGEDGRTGFGYGTLAGHPERGEECFVVDLADDGTVWFTVQAFSRPASWYARLAGPLVPVVQRWYARRLGRTLRRIVAAG